MPPLGTFQQLFQPYPCGYKTASTHTRKPFLGLDQNNSQPLGAAEMLSHIKLEQSIKIKSGE